MGATIPVSRTVWSETGFVRLWSVGGLATTAMWLEVLAASVFTFEATRSGFVVAVVSAARAAPLLLFGALTGVLGDAVDRRLVLAGGLVFTVLSAASVVALAGLGLVQPWHLALAAFISGSAYATEFPARRRMVAESVGPALVDTAVAADSLTGYAARCFGPVLGGLAFQRLGLVGAFAVSGACNAAALGLALGAARHAPPGRQRSRPAFFGDMAEAMAFVRSSPVLTGLLAVTLIMNFCGYSYATLMAPIGMQALRLDSTSTGILAAAEPAGALCGGLLLLRVTPPGRRLGWMARGVAILSAGLLATAGLGAAGVGWQLLCPILAIGGLGSAVYTNMQTSLVMAEAPAPIRSRVMGLLTVCIGSWPLGMLLAGALAWLLQPLAALAALAGCALGLLGLVLFGLRRKGFR